MLKSLPFMKRHRMRAQTHHLIFRIVEKKQICHGPITDLLRSVFLDRCAKIRPMPPGRGE